MAYYLKQGDCNTKNNGLKVHKKTILIYQDQERANSAIKSPSILIR